MPRQLRREDYTVGWECVLPVELTAAQEVLDEEHGDIERDVGDNDKNLYALGSIGGHNVAIVCLPAGRIGSSVAKYPEISSLFSPFICLNARIASTSAPPPKCMSSVSASQNIVSSRKPTASLASL